MKREPLNDHKLKYNWLVNGSNRARAPGKSKVRPARTRESRPCDLCTTKLGKPEEKSKPVKVEIDQTSFSTALRANSIAASDLKFQVDSLLSVHNPSI